MRRLLNIPKNFSPMSKPLSSMSPFAKAKVALGAAVVGFMDPSRGDMIALLGELTGEVALRSLRDRMLQTEEGRRLLNEKPRIRFSHADIDKLLILPTNSFGYQYGMYMKSHGFSAQERDAVRFIDDPDLAYIMQRYREIHDFWHVLSGLPPSVVGEIGVKWLEMTQTKLPVAILSAFVAPLRLNESDKAYLFQDLIPWAAKNGQNSVFLLSVPYEDYLEMTIDDVRETLGFTAAPPHPRLQ